MSEYINFTYYMFLLAVDRIFVISIASSNKSFNSSSLIKPDSIKTSSQNALSSASSITIDILLKNSALDRALHTAR